MKSFDAICQSVRPSLTRRATSISLRVSVTTASLDRI